jgi:hypothetical protein
MRNQKAQRLARWSAAIALLVAASVAGVYLHRAYLARRERASAPPALPASVEEHSAGFSFSKVEGDRTIYTVRAANATQFKDGNRNLLEDVWITSYGQQGDRNDTLRTKSCDYVSASSSAAGSASSSSSAGSVGTMVCAGDVEIDLESASDAKTNPSAANGEPSPAAHILHVSTSNLSFEQDSGVASTDHAVKFRTAFRFAARRTQSRARRRNRYAAAGPASGASRAPDRSHAAREFYRKPDRDSRTKHGL